LAEIRKGERGQLNFLSVQGEGETNQEGKKKNDLCQGETLLRNQWGRPTE